jgi:multidrug efflux pump subunit AcrA (membrane-fusion protein)
MNIKKVAVFGVAVLILGSGFFAMKQFAGMKELPPERPKAVSTNYVKVNPVSYREMDTEVVAYGRITSSQTLSVIAEVGGRLLPGSIPLKPGTNFRKGQVLCRIYGEEARLTLQSRKSEFLNLIASSLPDLKIDFADDFDRWQEYFERIEMDQPLEPLPEVGSNKLKTFLATKNILRDYYNIKSLEENQRKYTIYAPYDGSIATINIEVGTIVNPGTNIASIIRTDELELEIPVEIEDIKWIEENAAVEVMSEDGSQTWIGKVARVADYVDPNTQSINVYVNVNAGPRSGLYDGMYLKTVIPGNRLESAMEIPRRVLQNDDEVFVVDGGVLKTRRVKIEKITRDQVLISPLEGNGLHEGDSLVIEAPANAIENMKVTTFNATSQDRPDNDRTSQRDSAQNPSAS